MPNLELDPQLYAALRNTANLRGLTIPDLLIGWLANEPLARPKKGKPKTLRPNPQGAVTQLHPVVASLWCFWVGLTLTPKGRPPTLTAGRQALALARLGEGYEEGTLQAALQGIKLSGWHIEKGMCTWEHAFKSGENVQTFATTWQNIQERKLKAPKVMQVSRGAQAVGQLTDRLVGNVPAISERAKRAIESLGTPEGAACAEKHMREAIANVQAWGPGSSIPAHPSGFIPLDPETLDHDMLNGPCKCGAWHSPEEAKGVLPT